MNGAFANDWMKARARQLPRVIGRWAGASFCGEVGRLHASVVSLRSTRIHRSCRRFTRSSRTCSQTARASRSTPVRERRRVPSWADVWLSTQSRQRPLRSIHHCPTITTTHALPHTRTHNTHSIHTSTTLPRPTPVRRRRRCVVATASSRAPTRVDSVAASHVRSHALSPLPSDPIHPPQTSSATGSVSLGGSRRGRTHTLHARLLVTLPPPRPRHAANATYCR